MIKIITFSLGIVFSILAQNAYSSDKNGRYWIYGVGRQTCETYKEARNNGGFSEISYKNWISGYLTASNRSSDDTYNLLGETDFQGALVWIDLYCKKHKKNTIYMAMANLSAVYYSRRKKEK